MSAGDYGIFLERPIAATMLGLGVAAAPAQSQAAHIQEQGLALRGWALKIRVKSRDEGGG